MVRCPKCKTIQAKTATTCQACGSGLAAAPADATGQPAARPATRQIVAGQEGSRGGVAVAERPAHPPADHGSYAGADAAPAGAAPPLGSGPVVLGPASDGGSHPSFPPGSYVPHDYTV